MTAEPVHLAYLIDNLGSGGAQRQAVEIAREVARTTDWRVSFLVYRDDDFYGPRLRDAGVPVHRIEKHSGLDWRFPRRLGGVFSREHVDVVHAFMSVPALWARLARHTQPRAERPALLASERDEAIAVRRTQGLVQRLAYRGSDAVTANSGVAVRAIVTKLGVPAERVHYAPNGIDLAAWDRAAEEPCPIDLEPGCFHIALVGRLQPQKNHALLIEALRRIPAERRSRWRVWFIGAETGGQAFAEGISRQVADAGLAEHVTLVPPTRAIAAVMAAMDLIVLPSRHEGFPNVVLEGMASRRAVVASRVGDVPNLLADPGAGISFESEDAEGLADALVAAEDMGADGRRRMGEQARRVVESHFALAAVTERYVALYQSLAAALRSARR